MPPPVLRPLPLLVLLLLLAGGGWSGTQGAMLAAAAAPAPHALPWLWSGIPGLSQDCDAGACLLSMCACPANPPPPTRPIHTFIHPYNTHSPRRPGGTAGVTGFGGVHGNNRGQGNNQLISKTKLI